MSSKKKKKKKGESPKTGSNKTSAISPPSAGQKSESESESSSPSLGPSEVQKGESESSSPSLGPSEVQKGESDVEYKNSRFRFTVFRPVGVLMIFVAVVVFGLISGRMLPLNLMPEISYPKLTIRTEYPGAAPAEVENDVARPLEEVLGVVTGVTQVSSISRAGYCDVELEFAWDTDMDDANQDVLEKLDAVQPVFPDEVEQPLILRYDPNLDPVLVLSLSGDEKVYPGTIGLKALRRLADRDLRRLLEPIPGVAAIKVKGGLEEEIQVELDEDALRRTNIGIETVIQRLEAENINLAGGNMREGRTRYLIRTVNEFGDLDDLRNLVIRSQEGRDIRLRDLGKLRFGHKDRDVITRVDGEDAIKVEVYKEADANIVDMARRVEERIHQTVQMKLRKEFDARLRIVSDRSHFIESSIDEVRDTALYGGMLAVLVLFLFLRNAKTTTIVAVAIPVSILMTFAPLNIAGVSLNIMSLGGLALGIGMLVDNSIVVLESIYRCKEEGDELIPATLRGATEVGSAVIASTLTSIAVFFPMVFVEGVAGQMFGDLGLTVVFSLLASLAVALFLIPMLASRQVSGEGDVRSEAQILRERFTTWGSVSQLVESFRSRIWLAILLLPYLLARFVLHLVLEIVAKILTTLFSWISTLSLFFFAVGKKLIGWLVWPILWAFDHFLNALKAVYTQVIRWSLRNAFVVLALSAGSFVVLFGGLKRLDSELIPEVHQGEFQVEMTFPVGTPLQETDRIVRPIEEKLREDVPRLRNLVSTVGSERAEGNTGDQGEHSARLDISVGPPRRTAAANSLPPLEKLRESLSEEEFSAFEKSFDAAENEEEKQSLLDERLKQLLEAQQKEQAAIDPGLSNAQNEIEALAVVREHLQHVPDLRVNVKRPVLFSFKTPIEVEIRGYELEPLAEATTRIEERLKGIASLRDVKASVSPGHPEVQIVYDRDTLARLGLDIRQVAERVRDKVQGTEATRFTRKDRKIPIRVRLEGIDEKGVSELRTLVVNPGGGRPVPLSAVADIHVARGPNEIRRIDQQRVAVVTANLQGAGLGNAVEEIEKTLRELELPPGIAYEVTGQSKEWETSSKSLIFALLLSVFLVYVIMASQFESLLDPLIILVSIPLALVGVVLVLAELQIPISVVVLLGGIMLAGIVVNNAIVLVDYINQLKARGMATAEAIELAGSVRLRPILMTTLTTVLGLLPMAGLLPAWLLGLGLGEGSEIRQPMAITVIAGLASSTVLTLVIIPTLYGLMDRIRGSRDQKSKEELLAEELAQTSDEQLEPERVGEE